jgi:phosphoribosyl 1,2-cyclic phosphate phosphodiesterase
MMKLTFLGTGTSQGVPMIACPCEVCHSADPRDRRLRASALVEVSGGNGRSGLCGAGRNADGGLCGENEPLNIVIDAGPDFREQMLRADVRRLDAILLTHEHKDHTGGLDDIRAFNYFQHEPVDVWATERVQRALRHDYAYAFEEHPYPGAPEMTLHTFSDEPFWVKGVEVVPVRGLHMKLPVTGFIFGRGGADGVEGGGETGVNGSGNGREGTGDSRRGGLAYLTDFNHIEDGEVEKLRGVEVLVVNALGHNPHISHFNLEQAIELARRVGAPRTYLTHMSHRMGFYAEQQALLPDGIFLAYDNLEIMVNG